MENIDFVDFSKDNFDPVSWLNVIFSTKKDELANGQSETTISKEMVTTNLVYKLQLMIEETNNSLEEIAQRMALSIPKVVGEAEVLNREAAELCAQVLEARSKLICGSQQASEAVGTLCQLDTVKKRLQETYKALQEANNWTTLTMDVDEVFESGDIEQIATKLISMQKSLEMLSLSSSFENQHHDKVETLEKLKDRFEKLIEPVLIDSLISQNSQSIERYSNLFKELHRSGRLISHYQSSLQDQLLKEWSIQVNLDSEETLLNWLNFLYDRLSAIWKTQMNFCMKVLYSDNFEHTLEILCNIYTEIISSLDPTIENCMEQYLERFSFASTTTTTTTSQGKQQAWQCKQKALIELKQLTNQFMKSIEQNIIDQYTGSEKINDFILRVSSFDLFIRTIYRPFATFNQVFLQLEKDRLLYEFEVMKETYRNTGLVNSELVFKLFVMARSSLKNYSLYIESYTISVVDFAIEPFLLQFFEVFNNYLQDNIYVHFEHRRTDSSSSKLKTSGSSSSLHTTTNQSPTSANWQVIQQALFSFQIVGEFLLQLDKLQRQIHLSLEECHSHLVSGQSSEDLTSVSSSSRVISYFQRFDMFILQTDLNVTLKEHIQKCLHLGPENILCTVQSESSQMAKACAKAVCDSILDYVHVYLSNFMTSIWRQLGQQINQQEGDQDDSLSFSPNEHITQIGQYLLTLPQHLEPFNPNENAAFKAALRHSLEVFTTPSRVQNDTVPNSSGIANPPLEHETQLTSQLLLERVETSATELLLDCILRQTLRTLLEQLLQLPQSLSASGRAKRKLTVSIRKQIAVDLSYLLAVCEDLGLTSTDQEFLLLVQVFNDVHSSESFQQILICNPNYNHMLRELADIISF